MREGGECNILIVCKGKNEETGKGRSGKGYLFMENIVAEWMLLYRKMPTAKRVT